MDMRQSLAALFGEFFMSLEILTGIAFVSQSRDMLSTPAAIPQVISPVRIELAMLVMDCSDDAHCLFTVLSWDNETPCSL